MTAVYRMATGPAGISHWRPSSVGVAVKSPTWPCAAKLLEPGKKLRTAEKKLGFAEQRLVLPVRMGECVETKRDSIQMRPWFDQITLEVIEMELRFRESHGVRAGARVPRGLPAERRETPGLHVHGHGFLRLRPDPACGLDRLQ